MIDERRKFARRKVMLTLLHIIFAAMAVFGISAMYLNSNYGKGIKWIYEDAYEDSSQFNDQLAKDIDSIFTYVGYKDMFETDGKLDMDRVIVQISRGPGEQGVGWTLDQIVRYGKTRGYYIDENFELMGSPISMEDDEEEVTIDFQSYNPDFRGMDYDEPQRMTMEELALDILLHLKEYYKIYHNYIENETNVNFRIEYNGDKGEQKVYTNAPEKTLEDIYNTGKYFFIPGNTIKMESNMTVIPQNAATQLEIWNPYNNDRNYMVLSVDTSYPKKDAYSVEAAEYKAARDSFITGMGGVILGGLGCVVTLALLMMMSGYIADGGTEVHLYPIDDLHTEVYVLLCAAATAVFIYIGRYVGIRLFSLFAPNEQWNYWNKMIKLIIVYTCSVLCGFGLLRRYKARALWENSVAKRALNASREYVGRVSYAVGTGFCYLIFIGFNAAMLWGLIFLFFYKNNRWSYQIMFYVFIVLYLGLDAWIYHLLFKKAVQRDLLDKAVSTISEGDTSYQIDTGLLSGKEKSMGDHLNNISSGLDLALQEQVKSERMKANLITNVSHDIKTPLTSIINYVDLLKREKIQNPKIAAYLEVLDQKSQRLKTLTEDLVEVSKASSGNVKLDMADIDLVELAQQTVGEFEERFSARRLELVVTIPDEVLMIRADGRHLWRVLENLYTNAVKYAMEHSRVYVDVANQDGKAVFTIKNVSESPLNISPDELTERFVRGDVSRTTEGSGLGLSIAKNLTQVQGGEFTISIDGDLFKAEVAFPVKWTVHKPEKPMLESQETKEAESEEDLGVADSGPLKVQILETEKIEEKES